MIQEEVIKTNEAVDLSWSVPTAGVLVVALVKFSAAPTTSENLQIIFKSKHGTDYDVQLYSVDPSTDSLTQIVWFPDLPVPINKKDKIQVLYDNTDERTIVVTIKGLDSSRF